jgi:AraC-like DNA-binding protein
MPFASKIRKDILKVLDQFIIPALREDSITQFLAEPPFRFSEVVHWAEQKKTLSHQDAETYPIFRQWPTAKLVSLREPVLRFIYEGVSYERIGITTEMATDNAVANIICVQIPAPGVICFGNNIPQSDGTLRQDIWDGVTKSLLVKMLGGYLLVSLCERSPSSVSATHNLEVRDATLVQMSKIYMEELRHPNNAEGAQAQLFSLMHRLKRYFHEYHPNVGNSAWLEFEVDHKSVSSVQLKNQEVSRQIIDYMQTHLHQDLSLEKLAARFGLSVSHLNRIFRQSQGTTAMRFLTELRMEAAKAILGRTSERIGEVANLVGFSSVTSFSATFRKYTGHSPNQYRHLHHE